MGNSVIRGQLGIENTETGEILIEFENDQQDSTETAVYEENAVVQVALSEGFKELLQIIESFRKSLMREVSKQGGDPYLVLEVLTFNGGLDYVLGYEYDTETIQLEIKVPREIEKSISSQSEKRTRKQERSIRTSFSSSAKGYHELLNLLIEQDAINPAKFNFPEAIYSDDDKAAKTNFIIGHDITGSPVELASHVPHLAVFGMPSTGKNLFLKNIIAHGLSKDAISVWIADQSGEHHHYELRSNDSYASSIESIEEMLNNLNVELLRRYDLLNKGGFNNYLDISLQAIYLVLDDADQYLLEDLDSPTFSSIVKIRKHLLKLSQLGRAAGIRMFIASDRPLNDTPPMEEILANFGNKILVGQHDPEYVVNVLGNPSKFKNEWLEHPRRAVLQTYNKQKLIEAVSHDLPENDN